MWDKKCDYFIKKVKFIEKFYTAYQSLIVFFDKQFILSQIPAQFQKYISDKLFICFREFPLTGNEENSLPNGLIFSFEELKRYLLEEGQFKIFESSVKLMFSVIENFIISCYLEKNPNIKYESIRN